ncbi:serine/threonine-protein kinase [Streptomyces sp. NPDC002920]
MEKLGPGDPQRIGSYRLLARLGAGGMGQVYLARSDRGRTVAVKLVRPELAEREEFRARFRREVRNAQRVGGFWTAPVLDADTEAAVPWVATGYVAGPSLQQVVGHDHGPLPERSVRILAAGLAHALTNIHAAGIVHRDLKPSNVMVTIEGPRVIDFGVARAMESVSGEGGGLTQAGAMVGSPGFMAPEQVRGEQITPASDVFCLGSVLAYAATGVLPFDGGSGVHAQMFRIAEEEPDLSGVPEGIADLVRACLRKDPAARPTLPRILELSGAHDTVSDGRSRDPWLPGSLVAQLGRHAVRLLDVENPEGTGTTTGGPSGWFETRPGAAAGASGAAGVYDHEERGFEGGGDGAPGHAAAAGGRPGQGGAPGRGAAAGYGAAPGNGAASGHGADPGHGEGRGHGAASGNGAASGHGAAPRHGEASGHGEGRGHGAAAGQGGRGHEAAPEHSGPPDAFPTMVAGVGAVPPQPGAPAHPAYGAGGGAQQHPQPGYGNPYQPPGGPPPYNPYAGGPAADAYGRGAPEEEEEPGRRSGRTTALLVTIALVVALAAGGSVYAFLNGGGDDGGKAQAGTEPTRTTATDDAPTPAGSASESASPSASATGGVIPTGFLGTWTTTFDVDGAKNTRRLTIEQGAVGDAVLALVAEGAGYRCEFTADLTERPGGDGPLEIGPSKVTTGEPRSSCSPGEATEVTLLSGGRLQRVNPSSGEKLTYTRR